VSLCAIAHSPRDSTTYTSGSPGDPREIRERGLAGGSAVVVQVLDINASTPPTQERQGLAQTGMDWLAQDMRFQGSKCRTCASQFRKTRENRCVRDGMGNAS
jgi:hypothetical protein